MSKYTFSSFEAFIQLLSKYPALFTILAFQSFKPAMEYDKHKSSCGCSSVTEYLNRFKGQFEPAIRSLQPNEIQKLKSILNVEQVCYYVKRNGTMQQICI